VIISVLVAIGAFLSALSASCSGALGAIDRLGPAAVVLQFAS
jgi:hypothetical protein